MKTNIIYLSFNNFSKMEGSTEHSRNIVKYSDNYENFFYLLHKNSIKNIKSKKLITYGFSDDKIINNETLQIIYFLTKYFFKILEVIKEIENPIIYTRATLLSPFIIMLFRLFGIKNFIHEHNGIFYYDIVMENKSYLKKIYAYSQYLTFKYSKSNRVVTPQIGDFFYKKYNLKNYFVLGNGFDENGFKNKKIEYVEDSNFKLLFVGNLAKWQGVYKIVEAINLLINYKKYKNLIFNIVGNGQEFENLNNLIKEYKLDNNIFLCGNKNKNDVIKYIYESDILCAPFESNRNNIVGNSALKIREYLASGKPMIISDINYDLDLKNRSILFDSNNIDDLKNKLIDIFENYNKYYEISQNNIEYSFNELTWKSIVSKLYREIQNVC